MRSTCFAHAARTHAPYHTTNVENGKYGAYFWTQKKTTNAARGHVRYEKFGRQETSDQLKANGHEGRIGRETAEMYNGQIEDRVLRSGLFKRAGRLMRKRKWKRKGKGNESDDMALVVVA